MYSDALFCSSYFHYKPLWEAGRLLYGQVKGSKNTLQKMMIERLHC